MPVTGTFIAHAATCLVDVDDLSTLDRADVRGCHVRLCPSLTVEERSGLDVPSITKRLLDAGAVRVVVAVRVVRPSVTPVPGAPGADTPLERGLAALRTWLRASGEDDDVVEAAIELVGELVLAR